MSFTLDIISWLKLLSLPETCLCKQVIQNMWQLKSERACWSVTNDDRGQRGGKNTQGNSTKQPDQIKEAISAEWTLISLYKKEGWTPTRTAKPPVKVSDLQSFISRRRASSLMNNAGHDHLLPETGPLC